MGGAKIRMNRRDKITSGVGWGEGGREESEEM